MADDCALQITRTVICDPSVLKLGVRYIFSTDGSLITDVDQLLDGHSYVCSSSPVYKRLDYESITGTDWISTTRKVSTPAVVAPTESFLSQLNQRHHHLHHNGTVLLPVTQWRHQLLYGALGHRRNQDV